MAHSEETKQKIRSAMLRIKHRPPSQLGNKRSVETIEKIRKSKIGHSHTEETRNKMSISRSGSKNHFYGKKHSQETKVKIRISRLGKIFSKKNRSLSEEKHRLRHTDEWKQWRKMVFTRDNYTCMECKKIGGVLEPHHIIPLRISLERLFDIKNGITLCRACHVKTIRKEEHFVERYSALIT